MRRESFALKTLVILAGLVLMSAPIVLADHCQCDFDCDGNVYPSDFSVFLGEYGKEDCTSCPSQSTPCEGTLSAGGRWCDQGDGTVKDMTTGLVWLQKADWGGAYAFWVNTMDGVNAQDRAALLWDGSPFEGTAGLNDGSDLGDWRLPTYTELSNIIVGDEYIRSDQMYFFTGVLPDYYWTVTAFTFDSNYALVRGMMDEPATSIGLKDSAYCVWPVRSDN